ncbi:MAG: TrbI/VirB10 family protein [Acidithiobacillus sp.]
MFSTLFGKSGAKENNASSQAAPDSSAGPRSASGIDIKPSGDAKATRIRKTPLIVGMVVIGVGGYAAVEYMQGHNFFSGGTQAGQSVTIQPAKNPQGPGIPKSEKKPLAKPKAPVGSTASSASEPADGQGGSPASSAPQNGVPKKNPYAAQDAAFQASIGGGSSGGSGDSSLTWKQPQSSAPTATENHPSSQIAAMLRSAQSGADRQSGKKKPVMPLVTRETSPYELLQGAVIPAVLSVGIKSYLPGEISAVVSRDVYSSVNGATLLIPAGSKLVGTYNTKTALGINRLQVAWTRIEYPNGTYMNLPGYEGAGGSGYAGFAGEVNNHTWLVFKNALLLSIVNVGMAIASPTSTSSNTTGVTGNQALQDGEQSLAQTFGQAESQLLQKYIDIAPTITIQPGYLFNVVVTKDMVFPGPYNSAMQTGSGAVHPALPSADNPYGG